MITESGLRLDEQREATSILKAAPAKIEVNDRELREIVNECVDGLDDELRKLLRLNRWDGTSERAIASQTGLNVSAVHRRIEKALKDLKKSLEARGIDESWLNDRD